MSSNNNKLRSAEDVINRLTWCPLPDSSGTVMIGYEDRVKGPMEKPLQDFLTIDQGGDIPLHRIWYFRCQPPEQAPPEHNATEDADTTAHPNDFTLNEMILWDRVGRIDKIFGSGQGADTSSISPETTRNVRCAIRNMARLDQLAEERRQLRDHESQRKALKRQAKKDAMGYLDKREFKTAESRKPQDSREAQGKTSEKTSFETSPRGNTERYTWHTTDQYEYSRHQHLWIPVSSKTSEKDIERFNPKRQLHIVSWNVLSDLHYCHDNAAPGVSDASNSEYDNLGRWGRIVAELESTNADIIALQEVTPEFLVLLASATWVQQQYSLGGAAPGVNTETVNPTGNILIWHKSRHLRPLSTWICRDSEKQRTGMLAAEWNSCILLVVNMHLLADPLQRSAAQARRRELASIVGQLQVLESKFFAQARNKGPPLFSCVPILLGDFNANEQQKELEDGCFSGEAILGKHRVHQGFFVDTWPLLGRQEEDGYTFHPARNSRAKRTRASCTNIMAPKRNDRIYLARRWENDNPSTDIPLIPVQGRLLGTAPDPPPSDHFGLSVVFQPAQRYDINCVPVLHHPLRLDRNAWTACSESTNDTLLGLVLDQGVVGGVPFLDPQSTLPIPHITMIHGFVELGSSQGTNLAVQACTNAVDLFLEQQDRKDGFCLSFNPSCLDVLTHPSLATLVALPDKSSETNSWLFHLYQCFITLFRRCHHQESRFETGWTPHVSLGSYGTTNTARARLVKIRESREWITEDCYVPVTAVTLFKRHQADGKIYAVASVPLSKRPPSMRKPNVGKLVLSDMGETFSRYFQGQTQALAMEIERACQNCALVFNCGKIRLVPTGSYAMGVCLPEISDLDCVVQVRAGQGSVNVDNKAFFQRLASDLTDIHFSAKVRTRTAGTAKRGVVLDILTVKLWPWAPSVDLIMCRLDEAGCPVDASSDVALLSLSDVSAITESFKASKVDLFRVFQGVLRVVKLWAWREHIYGASMGYLGGGGFAVLVERVLQKAFNSGALPIDEKMSFLEMSMSAIHLFFQNMSTWTSILVSLEVKDGSLGDISNNELERAIRRGTMCVLAPHSKGNHGRNSTRSTTLTTLHEFRNASSRSAETILKGQLPVEEQAQKSHSHIICVQISVPRSCIVTAPLGAVNRPILAEIKGWGSSHLLQLLGKLERESPTSNLRLYSNPARGNSDTKCWFTWLIGIDCPQRSTPGLLASFANSWTDEIKFDLPDYSYEIRIELVEEVSRFVEVPRFFTLA